MKQNLSWKITLPLAIIFFILSAIIDNAVLPGSLSLLGFIVLIMAIVDILRNIFK